MNNMLFKGLVCFILAAGMASAGTAQEPPSPAEPAAQAVVTTGEHKSFIWDALNRADYAEMQRIFEAVVKSYAPQAMQMHSELTEFPPRERIDEYALMNDVAEVHFAWLEGLRMQGKTDEAVALARQIILEYPYSQAWDASRGGYWSIAEKSRIIMDQLTGVAEKREEEARNAPLTRPTLFTPGRDAVVDYTKYGTFVAVGTKDYRYQMGNPALLAAAVGQGIFPNTADVLKDPRYRELYKEGRLQGGHWDFVNTRDLEAAFYKWATAPESPGVKLFYTALVLERAGLYLEAIRAYHACVVHFPRTFGMTYWQTPWYPAQASVAKIKNILRLHPELNLSYKGGRVHVVNGADRDTGNDIFIVDPGVITLTTPLERFFQKVFRKDEFVSTGAVKRRLGGKKVQFVQYANGHWQMLVDGKPFIIKGVTYLPTKIGQSPDKGTLENWMYQQEDAMHRAWVDRNRNDVQDPDELNVGDFRIMKEMGVNAIRIYDNEKINKELLRELYATYGIRTIVGNFLGKYAIGSGADWKTGTDYENPEHLANMMKNVLAVVQDLKDEPFVLMWLLGNENNYGVASNADKKPDAYFRFVNEVAKKIKELDPDHPVTLCNGDVLFIDKVGQLAPEIDAYGANMYRGDYGFGSYWDEVREGADRPAFVTEYGAPAYSKFSSMEEAEEAQALYHRGSWLDIMANTAGRADGVGNAVGGIVFEWLDEWWKNYEPAKHDTKADVIGPFAGGYYFEEWFGLAGQGDGTGSPLKRQLRKSYFIYQQMWKARN